MAFADVYGRPTKGLADLAQQQRTRESATASAQAVANSQAAARDRDRFGRQMGNYVDGQRTGQPNVDVYSEGVTYDPKGLAYNGTSQGQYNDMGTGAQQRGAAQLDQGAADQARGQMGQGLAYLGNAAAGYQGMADGTAPSLAQAQLQSGMDRGIRAQMAMANSARGGGLAQASAMRQAQLAGDQQRAGMIGQAAQLRAQEHQAGLAGLAGAGSAYGGLAGSMRGQDLQAAGANLGATMQQRGMNDAYDQHMKELGLKAQLAEMAGRTQYQTLQKGADLQTQQFNAGMTRGVDAQQKGMLQNIIGAGTLGIADLLKLGYRG